MSSEDVATDIGQNQAEAQEKMLPQSEVDRIVGARVARERAQMESQYRQQQPAQGMGGELRHRCADLPGRAAGARGRLAWMAVVPGPSGEPGAWLL